jgi:hypothetical protein
MIIIGGNKLGPEKHIFRIRIARKMTSEEQ